jgi:hypothetical protein
MLIIQGSPGVYVQNGHNLISFLRTGRIGGGAGAPATKELHCGKKRREKDGRNLLGCSPSADFEQKRQISRVKASRSSRFLFRLLQQAAARAAEKGGG